MKKLFLLTFASMMTFFALAAAPTGMSKGDAIPFKWEGGVTHEGYPGSPALWYRVDLSPLKQEDNPSLTLYLTNPSRSESVTVSVAADVMGSRVSKNDYVIEPHQYKTHTENASLLIRTQNEVYLTLKSDGKIHLSAKVFEASDLDETCKDARTLKWDTETSQTAGYAAWWRLDILNFKDADHKDAKITITNNGTGELTLKAGQSLDCPSSGLTKRSFTLAAGETMFDTIPQSMVKFIQPTEIYFSLENNQPITMKVELIDQPEQIEENAIIKATDPYQEMHVEVDKIDHMPEATTLYRFDVAEMRDTLKYEPEFTYRNVGNTPAKVIVRMAFEVPAYGTNNTEYEIAPGEEEVVVYKKNMLEGLEDNVPYIYLLTTVEGDVQFTSRFKHIREGKACKTNIDFNWETGHVQDARTTQWYAVNMQEARESGKDITVHVLNLGSEDAKVKASFTYNCPTRGDEQEVNPTIPANGQELTHTISWTSYAMMEDNVWFGIQTSQDIKFWVTTEDAETHAPDDACLDAEIFPWKGFVYDRPNEAVWYKVPTDTLKNTTQFPLFYIKNLGTEDVTIHAELAVDCPNELPTEKRTLTIPVNSEYKLDSIKRATFNGIHEDTVYLRIIANQKFSLVMLMKEKPAGSACDAALPFNSEIGNDQNAGDDLWYEVDLSEALSSKKDVKIWVTNKENKECELSGWLSYDCASDENPISKIAKLKPNETRMNIKENSWFQEQAVNGVMYIRVKGTTALHIQAELVDPAPFDPIDEAEIDFIPLQWNQSYTQEQDTAWYYVSKDQLDILEQTGFVPEASITNLSDGRLLVRVDYAFHMPITQTMLNKSWTIKAGGSVSEVMAPMNRDRYIKNDSVLIRVIAKGKIEINTTLVNPYNGGDCSEAVRLNFGDEVKQDANTVCWYRINIGKIKEDKSLHGKSVKVYSKNLGRGSATIKVGAFESCDGDNLFEQYEDRAKHTVSAGRSVTRSFPAYVVYGFADNVIYVRVETNQPLVFSTTLSDYAVADEDPNQQKAKLVVPGVDYYIPADTTVWYRACFKNLFSTYALMESTQVTFRNLSPNKPAKITGTAAFQDTLTFATPVRTRTVSAGRDVTKTWKKIVEYAYHKVTDRTIDLSEQKTTFVDSIIRHFADTSSHLAAQVRIRTTQPLYFRIDGALQTKGDSIINPILFDWEHGNVNPKGKKNWYLVDLRDGMERIPEGKELRLHVTNWNDFDAKATATINLDVKTEKEQKRTINYTLKANEDTWRNIDRKLLVGQSNPLIEFHSEADVHIWAEVVDARERGKVHADTTLVACDGDEQVNPYTKVKWTVDFSDKNTTFIYDSIPFINDTVAAEWDSICTVTVVERKQLELLPIPGDKIVVKKGDVLNVDAATEWLLNKFEKQHADNDTVRLVDTLLWEWSINNENTKFEPIPTTPLLYEGIVLRYRVVTQCKDTIPTEPSEDDYFFNTVRVTDDTTSCRPIVWDGKTYTADDCKEGPVTAEPVTFKLPNNCDSIVTMTINVTGPVIGDELPIDTCRSFHWDVTDKTYTESGRYTATIETADGKCDSIVTLVLNITDPVEGKPQEIDTCGSYKWEANGETYTQSGTYRATIETADGKCDSIAILQLNVTGPVEGEPLEIDTCGSYKWEANGETYTQSGRYTATIETADGKCDSIAILQLNVTGPVEGATTEVSKLCSYTWTIIENGEPKEIGTYSRTKVYDYTTKTADGRCDSVIHLDLHILNAQPKDTVVNDRCNEYKWPVTDVTYDKSGIYTHTVKTKGDETCDSIHWTLKLTLRTPNKYDLEAVSMYSNRLVMINRLKIKDDLGWELDSLGAFGEAPEVVWYRADDTEETNKKQVGIGYYHANADGNEPLVGVYWAEITVDTGDELCDKQYGFTKKLICEAPTHAAPALMPSLVRPGEDIRILNLDPDKETFVRVYTTEGMLQGSYTVQGEDSFTIKAAAEHGFYLVELSGEGIKSTLRYIVK